MRTSSVLKEIEVVVKGWIADAVASASGALSAHALNGPYHTGSLADHQAPQFLKSDGSRTLTGNLTVASGITIDGVDLSDLNSAYLAHLAADSHTIYASAEGSGTRRAYEAGRLNLSLLAGDGISVSPTGIWTANKTVSVSYGLVNPPKVGLGPQTIGTSPLVARNDHVHELDLTIAPTWSGLHTFSAGAKLTNGQALTLGDDTTLARTATNLIETGTSDSLLIHGLVGIGSSLTGGALAAKLHILGTTSDTLLMLDGGGTRKFKFSTGTGYNGATDTPLFESDNYASQTTGIRLDAEGLVDARYIYADEMHVRAFIADVQRAHAGGNITCKSLAVISRNFTVPAMGGTAALYVHDLPGLEGLDVFEDGDYVRLRVIDFSGGGLVVFDAWGLVETSGALTEDNEQAWDFTTAYAGPSNVGVGKVAVAGGPAMDYGVDGDGWIEDTVLDPNSPWLQMATWETNPWTAANRTVHMRLGKLTGITSTEFGALSGWGLYSENAYLKGAVYATSGRITDSVIIGGGTLTAQNIYDWTDGTDMTVIDGGSIKTNTIEAYHLNVGLGGGNLIVGANWQDDPTGADGTMPGGWDYAIGTGVDRYRLEGSATDTTTGVAGRYYMWGRTATNLSTAYFLFKTSTSYLISVDASKPYTLSLMAKTLSGTPHAYAGVVCYDVNGNVLDGGLPRWCTLAGSNPASTPTRYSGTIKLEGAGASNFVTGTKKVQVIVYPVYQTGVASSCVVWDVQFEQGDVKTAWTPGLRGNVQIDSLQILIGTPNAQRLVLGSTGLRGYDSSNSLQAYFDTDGKIKFGGGQVIGDASGITFTAPTTYSSVNALKWMSSSTIRGEVYAYYDGVNYDLRLFGQNGVVLNSSTGSIFLERAARVNGLLHVLNGLYVGPSPAPTMTQGDAQFTGTLTVPTIATEAWTAPSLSNSWVNYSASESQAGYWKDPFGVVHLRGVLKDGTVGATIFTLPSGYRPPKNEIHAIVSNNTIGRITVNSSGTVVCSVGNNAFISLDGITFRTS